MRVKEIVVDGLVPTVLSKQAKMRNFMRNMVSHSSDRPLTNAEKAATIIWYKKMKKAADKQYAARLKHQLAQTAKV